MLESPCLYHEQFPRTSLLMLRISSYFVAHVTNNFLVFRCLCYEQYPRILFMSRTLLPVLHCLCHEQFPQNSLFLSRTINLYFVAYVTNNFPVLCCLCHEQLTRNSLLVSRTNSPYFVSYVTNNFLVLPSLFM